MRFIFSALLSLGLVLATKSKLLLVIDSGIETTDYFNFLGLLKDLDYEVDVKKATDSDLAIIKDDELLYENLILFSPKTTNYGNNLKARKVVDFVNLGGNLLLAADRGISPFYTTVGAQLGVLFDDGSSQVMDMFQYNNTETSLVVKPTRSELPLLQLFNKQNSPILFQGIGHSLVPKASRQSNVIVKPNYTSFSKNKEGTRPALYGEEMALITSLQAHNNARVVITGSIGMFSDRFFDSQIEYTVNGKVKQFAKSGNQPLVQDLVNWAFQKTLVLKVGEVSHRHVDGEIKPNHYRIKENMEYSIEISEFKNGNWVPYKIPSSSEDAIQLEIKMLDAYIRTDLKVTKEQGEFATYSAQLQLPDVYGVFTFQVDYRRPFLTELIKKDVVPIHPFRHNDYDRFILQAFPYYASSLSMAVAFILFAAVYLFNLPKPVAGQGKKSQ